MVLIVFLFLDGVQSKCIDSDCKYGSICSPVKTGHGSECRCPEKCLDYPEVVYWLREKYPTSQSESLALTNETVCGIDGQDYENFCQLKKISCLKSKPISVKYYGSCGKHSNHKYYFLHVPIESLRAPSLHFINFSFHCISQIQPPPRRFREDYPHVFVEKKNWNQGKENKKILFRLLVLLYYL